MQTTQYKYTSRLKYTSDSVFQVRTHLLTSDFGSSARGERQFLSLSYHTMLTTPQRSAHLVVQSRFLNTIVGPQLLNTMVGPQLLHTMVGTQLYGRELHSLSQWQKLNCLSARSTVNSQLTLFQNLQILKTIASGHDIIHTPTLFSYLGFIMTIVTVISFVHERKLYPMLCTWTKSRIVQSPTKLNDKI